MKLKQGVIITKTDDRYIAVAAGEAGKAFSGMIKLNSTATFIIDKLREDSTVSSLEKALTEEFDVSAEAAHANVIKVIDSLNDIGLIEI